ncbi:MAG: hypothetical protein E4G98_06280 [Promethearchaeota archaeon]|nr:MAG: hypothetical protein E4G98_06280 [Candidatus Lokiarchaeota archaeon]
MKKKLVTTLLIAVLTFSSFGMALVSMANANTGYEFPDVEPIRLDAKFRETAYGIQSDITPASAGASSVGPRSAGSVGDMMVALSLDDYNGYYFWTTFECRAAGTFAEIWVQVEVDLAYPEGDPRPTPVITDDQITYLMAEFDNTIYPITTAYFGDPDFHDGSFSAWGNVPPRNYYEEEGKSMILVSNVRDEAYYDRDYPYYIAGFYSPTFEDYIDRNIISIDSHDWAKRVGPDGSRPN